MSTVTARVGDETAEMLEELSVATKRSKSFHVQEALRMYLDQHAWQVAQTKKSMEEVARGEIASDQEVAEAFAKWGLNVEELEDPLEP